MQPAVKIPLKKKTARVELREDCEGRGSHTVNKFLTPPGLTPPKVSGKINDAFNVTNLRAYTQGKKKTQKTLWGKEVQVNNR